MDELLDAIYEAIEANDELTVAETITALELVKHRLLRDVADEMDEDEDEEPEACGLN